METSAGLTVPEAVRNLITGNQALYQCLKMGLINYTALANRIKPEVEKIVGDTVNLNTIVVAIKRFADAVEKIESVDRGSKVFREARISLTGSIVDVGVGDIDRFDEDLSQILHKLFDFDPQFRLFQSENFMRIFAEDIEGVRELFSDLAKKFDIDMKKGFAKISIKLPVGTDQQLGLVSLISDLLYSNGVVLHDAFFGRDEMVLVVDENLAARAYDILRRTLTIHSTD